MNDIDMESQEYKNTLLRRKRGQSVPKSTKQNKITGGEMGVAVIVIYFYFNISLIKNHTTMITNNSHLFQRWRINKSKRTKTN